MLIGGRAGEKKKVLILPNDWSHVVKGKIRLFDSATERVTEREKEREQHMKRKWAKEAERAGERWNDRAGGKTKYTVGEESEESREVPTVNWERKRESACRGRAAEQRLVSKWGWSLSWQAVTLIEIHCWFYWTIQTTLKTWNTCLSLHQQQHSTTTTTTLPRGWHLTRRNRQGRKWKRGQKWRKRSWSGR